jgi:pimeloyl-ACP methyl ester carboxylesterase
MPSIKIEFIGSQGSLLSGRLDTPATPVKAWAIFAHCFTCSKDTKATSFISSALSSEGFGVLRFDFTGLGSSAGDFADTSFSSNVEDLIVAARWLEANHVGPSLLVGHSLGGAAVLAATSKIHSVRAVATLCAPFEPAHVTHQFQSSVNSIEFSGQAVVSLGGRPFTIRKEFLEDLVGQNQLERIQNLEKPLLILHAPTDKTVSIDNAKRIFEAAKHPKSFISLDGADHLLNSTEDARFSASLIAAWSKRYI